MKLSRNRAKCPSHGFCICKNRVQPFQKAAPGFILFMPQGIRTLPRYRAGRTAEGRGALRIRLIPRICAVAFVLAQIQPPHAGKHHEHDADVSEQGGQPLPATQDVRGRTIRPAPLQSLSAGLRRHPSSSSSKSGSVASFLVLGALFSSACAV